MNNYKLYSKTGLYTQTHFESINTDNTYIISPCVDYPVIFTE